MLQPVHEFLTESTVHSFVHYTGDRRFYVKLVWAAAFLASAIYCSIKVEQSVRKYQSGEVTTTVKANSLSFEFPDVYVCSENPISGSYSVNLKDNDTQLLKNYRTLVEKSLFKYPPFLSKYYRLLDYGMRLVHTLPFQFLADTMGHDWIGQNIVIDTTTAQKTKFYHPSFINCLKQSWPLDGKIELLSVSNILRLFLFLDPQLPASFDSKDSDPQEYYSKKINLNPFDWDFTNGPGYIRSTGLHVFFVPKGHYPSDLDTQVVLGPGFQHRLIIKMEDEIYDESDFAGQCFASDGETVDFVNPYSGAKDTYKYSKGACWYREMARLSLKRLNCSVWPIPLAWEYRNMRSCFNISLDPKDEFKYKPMGIYSGEVSSTRREISNQARSKCETLKPCKSRYYSFEYSQSSWPTERLIETFLEPIVNVLVRQGSNVPGLEYFLANSTRDHQKAGMLQISLKGHELLSSRRQLSIAYDFNSLVGDIGGFIGLFLGASFLSMLEFVELLHNLILMASRSKKESNVIGIETSETPTIEIQTIETPRIETQTQANKQLEIHTLE